jgi:hypothetical protein
MTRQKIDELLQVLMNSCQSEAIAIAETVRDSLDGMGEGDDPAEQAMAIAEEFRDWGQSLLDAVCNGHF